MNEIMIADGMIFLFGAMIGSFLNVCIVRLPLEQSIVRPGSHCPRCKTPIVWYHNIPLLSYVTLGGKCHACKSKISFRYFLVEFLTGVSFVGLYLYFGLTPVFFAYAVMISGFIVATFVDFEHRIIPDEISLGGIVVGIVLSLFIPQLHGISPAPGDKFLPYLLYSGFKSVVGVLIGGGSIYLMGVLGDFIFKKESLGGGDVKLMGMVGAFMGWELALLTFFVAPFFGAIYGVVEKLRTKDSAIAYGPFLVLGALISLFWGHDIIYWVFQGYAIPNINLKTSW